MNALVTDLRKVIAQHVEQADSDQVMQIAESLLSAEQLMAPIHVPFATPGHPRFSKLNVNGMPVTGEHVAVYDAKTGLIWTAAPLNDGKEFDHADALKACESLELLGRKDWRAPTIEELLSIVDYTRYDPAVDTNYFKGPYAWTWSSTLAKEPSGYAWYVGLDYGYSHRLHQGYRSRVRAVRAGQ